MHLGRIYWRLLALGPRLRLKRDAEKHRVEIQIDPGLVCPDGVAGMIGAVAFSHNPKHAPKAVDYEMIGAVSRNIFQQPLARSAQRSILILFEGRHMAFGGVK